MIFNKSERRINTRIPAISKLSFSLSTPDSVKKPSKISYGIIKNLSKEGLFFETTKLPRKLLGLLKKNKLVLSVSF